jgi:predicted transcriptional regulator
MGNRIAADVMNPQVLAVRPEMTVEKLAAYLTENQITGAPVLDHNRRLVGVVSQTDIAASRGDTATEVVRDIMTPAAYTVPHDTPVADLARTMVTGRVHRLLVTRDGHVVGIVTSLDLLKALYESPPAGARAD